jgi:hypothetical protein
VGTPAAHCGVATDAGKNQGMWTFLIALELAVGITLLILLPGAVMGDLAPSGSPTHIRQNTATGYLNLISLVYASLIAALRTFKNWSTQSDPRAAIDRVRRDD